MFEVSCQDDDTRREVVVAALRKLDDDSLLRVLGNVLISRAQVAQVLVQAACPDLTYVPSAALTRRRSSGIISQADAKGGLIDCPELHTAFNCEVFVGKEQLGCFTIGQEVTFAVLIDGDHKPQAFDLQTPGGMGSAGTAKPLNSGGDVAGTPELSDLGEDMSNLGGEMLTAVSECCAAEPTNSGGDMTSLACMMPTPVSEHCISGNGIRLLGRFMGVVRNIEEEKNAAFICSDQLREFGVSEDCWIHKHELGPDFTMGSEVSFTACIHAESRKPFAKDVRCAKGQVGSLVCNQTDAGDKGFEGFLGVYIGQIARRNEEKGFGFIVCPALQQAGWEGDAYVHARHIKTSPFKVGDTVRFQAFIWRGRLQGRRLMAVDSEQVSMQAMGGGMHNGDLRPSMNGNMCGGDTRPCDMGMSMGMGMGGPAMQGGMCGGDMTPYDMGMGMTMGVGMNPMMMGMMNSMMTCMMMGAMNRSNNT
eukprot:TRINITY_DN2073_c0_g3_i1.p1 TRINITY_DN2073_c0_g3~~TRINITY_DN2073_c0_g3_i1.p1  ORF type:complete len:476 (+),score=88.90 TRINITY_DN2073_c0_g3_i1:183-1610(+)